MPSPAISRLWRLHQLDAEIADIRKRAAALNPGNAEKARLAGIEAERGDADYRALHAEQTDLELQAKGTEDKIAKDNDRIFSGKVTNAREVENLQKEVAALRRTRDRQDERLLELLDLLPPAQKEADEWAKRRDAAKKAVAVAQREAVAAGERLKARFAELAAERPLALKAVQDADAALLTRYDAIRKKSGTGMAEVKAGNCTGCGTAQSERVRVAVTQDKTVTCEGCGRLLYWTDGLV